MLGSPSSLAWPLTLLLAVSACGLRSDPFAISDALADDGGDGDALTGDAGDPTRAGTCFNPLDMPFAPMTLRGDLSGPSFSQGWCGSDGGPEDVYTLVPDYDVDVLLSMPPTNPSFSPTLRVIEGGCESGEGTTKICTQSIAQDPFHFLAEAGKVYSVIIDSRDDEEGGYELNVDFGWPPIDQCPVHPELIRQQPGSTFLWNNEFSQGQGRVDGYCGGPGRENMFPLQADYPGNMIVTVESSGGFAPVISMRTDCAALSELACASDGVGGVAQLVYFIAQPGLYYLSIDQGEIGSGGYALSVEFE